MFGNFGDSGFGASGFGGTTSNSKSSTTTTTNRSSIGGNARASISTSTELVRPIGDGILSVTLKQLAHNKSGLADSKMMIAGQERMMIRLVGWVKKGSVEEMNGEFLFRFSDGTHEDVNVLVSVGGGNDARQHRGTSVSKLIEKCTLRGGYLSSRVMITGSAGVVGDEIAIRAAHLRECDPLQATFYHPLEVLNGSVQRAHGSKLDSMDGKDVSNESIHATMGQTSNGSGTGATTTGGHDGPAGVAYETVSSLVLPTKCTQVVDESDPMQQIIAKTIEHLAKDLSESDKFVSVGAVLDILCSFPSSEPRKKYLEIMQQKVTDIEFYTKSGEDSLTELDEIYFLLE